MAKSIAATLLLIVLSFLSRLVTDAINQMNGSDLDPFNILAATAAYLAIKNDLRLSARPNTPEGERDDE